MNRIWAGIDSGKTHHHCFVRNESGEMLLSRRIANDEPELLKLLDAVLPLGDQVTWAVDMAGGEPALLLALLVDHDQEVLYIPGRVVNPTQTRGSFTTASAPGANATPRQ